MLYIAVAEINSYKVAVELNHNVQRKLTGNMKKIIFVLSLLVLSACGGGGSDSGGTAASPGPAPLASLVGVYNGSATLTASAAGISETDTFPITITVTEDAMVRFDGDEPDETFTVPLSDTGAFSGSLTINEAECSGSVMLNGSVDGTTAAGTISGAGQCIVSGASFDVDLTGDFSASR